MNEVTAKIVESITPTHPVPDWRLVRDSISDPVRAVCSRHDGIRGLVAQGVAR